MSSAPPSRASDHTAYQIMLVEDEFLIRMTLAEVLADEGYQVLEASTGDEAVAMLASDPGITVLLTDIQLPGILDGYGLVDRARVMMPGLPVIFMTGRAETPADRQPTGREMYVAKPYLPSDICKALKVILAEPSTA